MLRPNAGEPQKCRNFFPDFPSHLLPVGFHRLILRHHLREFFSALLYLFLKNLDCLHEACLVSFLHLVRLILLLLQEPIHRLCTLQTGQTLVGTLVAGAGAGHMSLGRMRAGSRTWNTSWGSLVDTGMRMSICRRQKRELQPKNVTVENKVNTKSVKIQSSLTFWGGGCSSSSACFKTEPRCILPKFCK